MACLSAHCVIRIPTLGALRLTSVVLPKTEGKASLPDPDMLGLPPVNPDFVPQKKEADK